MLDLEIMSIVELREAMRSEFAEYMRFKFDGNKKQIEIIRKKVEQIMAVLNQKWKERRN